MDILRSEKVLLVLIITIFAAAFAWLVAMININNNLRRDLSYERLRSESLLSERLLMEKSLIKTQKRMEAVMDSLRESSPSLASTLSALE